MRATAAVCVNGEEVEINSLQRRRTIHRAHGQGIEGDERYHEGEIEDAKKSR